jgi:phosphohistidine phosphatase SixA
MKTVKELYIFRHAEKDLTSSGDPGLSIKGSRQALNIAKSIEQKTLPRPDKLWVSPKKRAIETFDPLTDITLLTLTIDSDLDQRSHLENTKEFSTRVRNFINKKIIPSNDSIIFICTHSDWVESLGWVAPLSKSIDFNELILASAQFLHFHCDTNDIWTYIYRGNLD